MSDKKINSCPSCFTIPDSNNEIVTVTVNSSNGNTTVESTLTPEELEKILSRPLGIHPDVARKYIYEEDDFEVTPKTTLDERRYREFWVDQSGNSFVELNAALDTGLYVSDLDHFIEYSAVKEMQEEIDQLKELLYNKNHTLEIAADQKWEEYYLNVFSNRLDRRDKKIDELQKEIDKLKGTNNA